MTTRLTPFSTNDTPRLETARLEISFGVEADTYPIFRFLHGESGREVTDTLIWNGPEHPDELREFFRLHEEGSFGEHGFNWLLRDKTGALAGKAGRAIGAIGLRPGPDELTGDIGYWLAPPYWGRGLMGEAILALADHAFTHYELDAVVAEVFPHNARGIRLVEKLGFVEVERRRNAVTKRDEQRDLVRYRLERPSASL